MTTGFAPILDEVIVIANDPSGVNRAIGVPINALDLPPVREVLAGTPATLLAPGSLARMADALRSSRPPEGLLGTGESLQRACAERPSEEKVVPLMVSFLAGELALG